jgi:hypothetical protein
MPMWDAPDALAEILLRASTGDARDAGQSEARSEEEELAGEAW